VRPDEVSRSARLVAACRALATAEGSICRDPQARWFVADEDLDRARALPALVAPIAARCRWIDDQVSAFASPPATVVILGAGFDTRALRLSRPGVSWFELDVPAMLEHKRAILGAHGVTSPAHAVPIDLATQPIAPALRAHPAFPAAGRRTCVIWEGVSYYLPAEAVARTLRQVAELIPAGDDGRLLFDWVTDGWIASRQRRRGQVRQLVEDWGEPMLFGFADLAAELAAQGLEIIEALPNEDLLPRYGGPPIEPRWYAGRLAAARRRP
jgi:methyltransferase (TIGR00027 family)